ncbi:cytochrome c biogenesis protein [archaeon]|nr:cytochrome c biogenesis protein [archaeon]
MEFKRIHALVLLGTVYLMALYGSYNALMVFGPIESPTQPMRELYRNVFFHVPINAVTYTAFTITLIGSVMYLIKRDIKWDTLASSSAKFGMIFGTLTLITGMVWAQPAWGSYWNWDPRETTTLILWFMFAAYFALRSSVEDDEAKARLSSVIGIFAYVGIPLTYISTTRWFSLHPKVSEFSMTPEMGPVLGMMILGTLALFFYLLWLDVKVKGLKEAKESIGGK